MLIFDGHIDTLSRLLVTGENFKEAKGHVSLNKLQQANVGAQFFAAFVHPRFYHGLALHRTLEMIDIFWNLIQEQPESLAFASTGSDVTTIIEQGKIACFLAIEGGEALEGNLANLRNFHRLGVRLITLTWNYRNDLAAGQLEGAEGGGLSKFGLQVIKEMNRLGMLIDVSHLNEPGFWDVLKFSEEPILASHSNAKDLCNHPRNLTNAQIKSIAEHGGVIGVNFYPDFLINRGQATLDHVVEHIMHFVNVGGSECVALGSDFDGINITPDGLENAGKISRLIPALRSRGVKNSEIEKIMGGNLLRICREVLG